MKNCSWVVDYFLLQKIQPKTNSKYTIENKKIKEKQVFSLKIIGLRIDVHDNSSIPSNKFLVDHEFVDDFFDLDRLKSKYDDTKRFTFMIFSPDIDDLSRLKCRFDYSKNINQCGEESSFHKTPIQAKRRKLKRADSDPSSSN